MHGHLNVKCLLIYVIWTTGSGAVSHRFNIHIPGCGALLSGVWMDMVSPIFTVTLKMKQARSSETPVAYWTDEIQIWRRWLWIVVTRNRGQPRTSGTYLLMKCYRESHNSNDLKWKAEDYTFIFYAWIELTTVGEQKTFTITEHARCNHY